MHRTPSIEKTWATKFLRKSRVAHLATATKNATPYVVPICFAYDAKAIYTPIDEKPKRTHAAHLRRILNINENPRVTLIADYYSEDWKKLHYVIIHGLAKVIHGGREHARATALLRLKYHQYLRMRLEARPIIRVTPKRIVAWRAEPYRNDFMRHTR